MKLFRRLGNIPPGYEETIFKPIGHDEFIENAGRLDTWCPLEKADIGAIELVREAVELKKLNGGLIKSSMFEDLVGDAYARLYEKAIPCLQKKILEGDHQQMTMDKPLTGESAEGARVSPPPADEKAPEKPLEKAPKTRAKGVTKREIQRKADSIAIKAATSRLAAKSTRLADEDFKPAPVEPSATEPPRNHGDNPKDNNERAPEGSTIQPSIPIIPSSVLPSLHGSGDEESELSDVDESRISEPEKPAKPMFPNLLAKRLASPNPGSEISSNVSFDGGDTEKEEHQPRALDEIDGDAAGEDGDGDDDDNDNDNDGDGEAEDEAGDEGGDEEGNDDEDDIDGGGGNLGDVEDVGNDGGDEGEGQDEDDGDDDGDEVDIESVPAVPFQENDLDMESGKPHDRLNESHRSDPSDIEMDDA